MDKTEKGESKQTSNFTSPTSWYVSANIACFGIISVGNDQLIN